LTTATSRSNNPLPGARTGRPENPENSLSNRSKHRPNPRESRSQQPSPQRESKHFPAIPAVEETTQAGGKAEYNGALSLSPGGNAVDKKRTIAIAAKVVAVENAAKSFATGIDNFGAPEVDLVASATKVDAAAGLASTDASTGTGADRSDAEFVIAVTTVDGSQRKFTVLESLDAPSFTETGTRTGVARRVPSAEEPRGVGAVLSDEA